MYCAESLAAAEGALQGAKEEAEEAGRAAAKAELDMQGLGEAYNALEAQNYQLEAQCSELRSQVQSHGALALRNRSDRGCMCQQ